MKRFMKALGLILAGVFMTLAVQIALIYATDDPEDYARISRLQELRDEIAIKQMMLINRDLDISLKEIQED